jgi:hypothetical protein
MAQGDQRRQNGFPKYGVVEDAGRLRVFEPKRFFRIRRQAGVTE